MKFSNIKKLPNSNYRVFCDLSYIEGSIERYKERYNLNLNPVFQRGRVWTPKQKTEFMEFMLMQGPYNSEIFLNAPNWHKHIGPMVIVDGLQRLTTVLEWLNDEVYTFGNLFSDFEDRPDPAIGLHINIAQIKTEQETLKWYLALNQGSTPHTQQELDKVQKLLESGVKFYESV